MLNFTSAPVILKENIVENFLGSSIIQLSKKEQFNILNNCNLCLLPEFATGSANCLIAF